MTSPTRLSRVNTSVTATKRDRNVRLQHNIEIWKLILPIISCDIPLSSFSTSNHDWKHRCLVTQTSFALLLQMLTGIMDVNVESKKPPKENESCGFVKMRRSATLLNDSKVLNPGLQNDWLPLMKLRPESVDIKSGLLFHQDTRKLLSTSAPERVEYMQRYLGSAAFLLS